MRLNKMIIGLAAAVLLTAIPAYAQGVIADVPEADAVSTTRGSLIGTWVLDVDVSASPDFHALQTFHMGGTVDETSDLLAALGEGPGHGVWQRSGNHEYEVTFELFIFNPDATAAGRIRVRESLHVIGENKLEGFAVADLILPDGTVIENVDNGPVTGTRVRVKGVTAEEMSATPRVQLLPRGTW